MSIFSKLFGDPNAKYIKNLDPLINQINQLGSKYKNISDSELKDLADLWRKEMENKKTLDDLLPEVFAATREAAKRTIASGHFDVQMIGAKVLHEGKIAEMKTGEGKTSYAVSPAAALNAIAGKGVHVITVNDYLSKRDAGWIGAVYDALGLSVGVIVHEKAYLYDADYINNNEEKDEKIKHLRPVERREAYIADITYGTNNEFGFDYLRDNMVQDLDQRVQRGHHYAIIDEIDSILIDEARTPLIISAPGTAATSKYQKFATLIPRLKEGEDYNIDEKMRAATLTEEGIHKMEQWLNIKNIYTEKGISEVHHIEQALKAHTLFQRDKDYVVKDNEIIIVDEFTGRMMYGRRYSEGLHQAIEAKEGVEVKQESVTMATITFQNYFRMYEKLSGMTGTAATEAEEFSKIYNLDVIVIPTNKSIQRIDQGDLIYKDENAKYKAVIKDVKARSQKGQPVLIGTISIEKNELFSHLLDKEGVKHNILNAKNHEKEARTIAEAGKKSAVTLATNMAGRGVDIVLGGEDGTDQDKEEIKKLGGLYVIGTERHESRRIDNQLRGRSGRQGDPGESRFYVSLQDDLMRVFGSDKIGAIMSRLGLPADQSIEHPMISKSLESAQKKVEGHHFDVRKHLVEYDDIINKHREVIYKKRNQILTGKPEELKKMILEIIENEIDQVVSFHTSSDDEEQWNLDEIYEVTDTIFPIPLEVRLKMDDIQKTAGDKVADIHARNRLINYLINLAHKEYQNLEDRINKLTEDQFEKIEKMILLRSIDMLWVEHIDAMDHLRTGIGLRGYGQKDPLTEYKREAYQMFIALQNNIQKQVAYSIYKVGMAPPPVENEQTKNLELKKDSINTYKISDDNKASSNTVKIQKSGQSAPVEARKKIGRNDPCPCGSNKKYKKCCGK